VLLIHFLIFVSALFLSLFLNVVFLHIVSCTVYWCSHITTCLPVAEIYKNSRTENKESMDRVFPAIFVVRQIASLGGRHQKEKFSWE